MTALGGRQRDVIPCPSEAAYKRHLRHHEVPCEGDFAEVARITAARRKARRQRAAELREQAGQPEDPQ